MQPTAIPSPPLSPQCEQPLDPFAGAKGVVDKELRAVRRLQSAAFAGDARAARLAPAAAAALEEQLAALAVAVAAMAAAPARYGLTEALVEARRRQVEWLEYEVSEVKRACAQIAAAAAVAPNAVGVVGSGGGGAGAELQEVSLADAPLPAPPDAYRGGGGADAGGGGGGGAAAAAAARRGGGAAAAAAAPAVDTAKAGGYYHRQLLGSRDARAPASHSNGASSGAAAPLPAAAAAADDEAYVQRHLQAHMVARQDEDLGDIEAGAARVKRIGLEMQQELERQSLLAGGLDSQVDAAHLRIRGARRRILEVTRAAASDGQLKMICALSLVLAVLIIVAFV